MGYKSNDDIGGDLDDFNDQSSLKQIDIDKLKEQVRGFKNEKSSSLLKSNSIISQPPITNNKDVTTLSLGEKLMSKGYITKDQLEIAIREQRESADKKELGTILVELNFITDVIISKVLAETAGVESVDLKNYPLQSELIKKIPKNIAAQYKIIPLELSDSTLKIATSDVYNLLALDQIKKYFPRNLRIIIFYSSDFQISEVIDQTYDYDVNIQEILKEIEDGTQRFNIADDTFVNPTVRLVDSILTDAVKLGASDIHFEPENEFVRVRYRIDGILIEMFSFHKEFWSAIVVRLKVMSTLNIAETRNPQDGRIAILIMGRKVDFRVSTMPTIYGENIVARILDKKKSLISLIELGLSQEQLILIKKLLRRPEGIVIVTGPTGSGKTTTLYSILSMINSIEINIMTLEDPVEYQLPIIRQSSIKEGSNLSFDNGVRSMMRQDPDVIFVGEVRDNETATMTLRAAMTGHQVFTTLHTNDAIGAIPRLIDLGVKGSILAGNIICTIAQRLARRLCNFCKEAYIATSNECKILGLSTEASVTLYKHKGCNKCHNTGYKGRLAIYEILPIDRNFDDLIAKDATRKQMVDYAISRGFRTMADEGLARIIAGISDFKEIIDTVDLTERLMDVDLPI